MSLKPRSHTRRWLKQELPGWEAEGLLSAASAEVLRVRYLAPAGQTQRFATLLISVFGACLIGAGVISLLAYNWDELSRPARAVLALSPLVVTQALAFLTLARWQNRAAVRESVCAGVILSVGAAISLIAQTYQIGGNFAQFMLTWFALALPAVYLLRSGWGYALCHLGLVVWIANARWNMPGAMPWFPLIFLATIPYYFWIRSCEDHASQGVLGKWTIALASAVGLLFWLGALPPKMSLFILAAFFTSALLLDQSPRPLSERPFAFSGAAALVILLLLLSQSAVWRTLSLFEGGLWDIVRSLAFAAVWAFAFARGFRRRRYWLLQIGLTPLLICALYFLTDRQSSTLPSVIFTLHTFAIGVVVLVAGIRQQRFSVFNLGLVLIGGLAWVQFFFNEWGFIQKGIAFIVVGLLFLVANLFAHRAFRKEPGHA